MRNVLRRVGVSRRSRRFVPPFNVDSKSNLLEERAAPVMFLLTLPNPGIRAMASVGSFSRNAEVDTNFTNGLMLAYAIQSGNDIENDFLGVPWSSGAYHAETYNRLDSPSLAAAKAGIELSVYHVISSSITAGGGAPTAMITLAQSGQGNVPAPVTWNFVDENVAGLPNWWTTHPGGPPIGITGTFSISYVPPQGTNGIFTGEGHQFLLVTAAAGFFARASGPTNTGPDLVITYPSDSGGGVYTLNTVTYTNFFLNGGSVNLNYANITTAAGEALTYRSMLTAQYAPVVGQDEAQLEYTFTESV